MDMDITPRSRRNPLEEAATYASGGRRKVESREETIRAVPVERGPDNPDPTEVRHQDVQASADLQALWEEFNHLKRRHDEVATELEATTQRETQARAELTKAIAEIADHESAAERLRSVITERDQEVHALRQRLLDSEEARAAGAADFLRQDNDTTGKLQTAMQNDADARARLAEAVSAIADRESAAEQLRLVIIARDQEIDELRQRLLAAEEARVADAAAFLESLNKHRP